MKVVIIGSGNVATVLGLRIASAKHKIVQVISRTLANAESLASTLKATATDDLKMMYSDADLYLVAVSDNEVENVSSQLHLQPGRIVVHTAGSVSREVLKNVGCDYGVLYPLQSLRKEMTEVQEIPIVVDGSTREVREALVDFTSSWSRRLWQCNDEQRLKLHVAAVIASNFTNHLYALVEEYCYSEDLAFNMLIPLIKETSNRIERLSPGQLQTGPAIRGDSDTIDKHLEMLKDYSHLKNIYIQLSRSIKDFYKVG